jgi:tungstate transport system substrate-binding protein
MARTGLGRPSTAEEILVASTMSTQDSGLFGYLLPIFKEKTGIDVKVLAQSTSRALDTARRGDADVVLSIPKRLNKHSCRKVSGSSAIR